MLRDPRLWGNDANEFKPERFIAKDNAQAEQLPDVSSIPFGFGRRYGAFITQMSWPSDWFKP
jgi:cytochrome P450